MTATARREATAGQGDALVALARSALTDGRWSADDHGRRRAVQWIDAHGFPAHKDEEWRGLPLGSVFSRSFRLADPEAARASAIGPIDAVVADLGGPRLVFVNGQLVPAACSLDDLPEGVTVRALGDVGAANPVDAPRPPSPPDAYRHAFLALNDALWTGGAHIRIDAGVHVEAPIHLVHLAAPSGAPTLSSTRSTLVADPGSSVHLVETFVGLPGADGLTNAAMTVHCADGARVDLDYVQDEAPDSVHLSSLEAHQAGHSELSYRSFALGASVARREVRVHLAGPGATADVDGLFVPRGEQFHDQQVLVEHAAPRTRSRQVYQGVADQRGRGAFNAKIVVLPGADGTDADQVSRNLLLSERAEIDTRPRLEIFTDDVRCTHGATVGQLDESALFYLRSRGIPAGQARAILVHAVVDQMVSRVPLDALRRDIAGRLAGIIDGEGGR